MADPIREVPRPGPVPRFELPDWRARWRIVAGITGRGFDLGLWSGEPVGQVMERWRTFRAAEPTFTTVVLGHQVHRAEVAFHGTPCPGWVIQDGVDGHVTDRPGVLLTVTVADCIPVYLVDPGRKLVGLLHAGWRGTAAGILARGVALFRERGSQPGDLVMHCGVGICAACYEVGPDVLSACGAPHQTGGAGHLDLRGVLAGQGRALGIGSISTSPRCSAHEPDHFWSHRASQGRAGRMVAYLGLLP